MLKQYVVRLYRKITLSGFAFMWILAVHFVLWHFYKTSLSIKPAEFKSSQVNRFGCNNNHNYLIDNKIERFIIHHIILVNGYWLLVIDYYHLPLTIYQLPITSYRPARLGPIIAVRDRGQKTEDGSFVLCFPSSVFATASRQGTGWIQAECETFCSALLPAILSFLSENRSGFWLCRQL